MSESIRKLFGVEACFVVVFVRRSSRSLLPRRFKKANWDFVVIDECLAVQNASAKRCPSAWRQIEVSTLGVLMLSATFFRSKFADLFYMIRMLRSPFPRSTEWLSATIYEHIVCQVPETDRNWEMRGVPVPLPPADLAEYRSIIEAYKRKQLNNHGSQDFRRLFGDLEAFLRRAYEGRDNRLTYKKESVMADAFYKACKELLDQGHRPLVFADTAHEAKHIRAVLCKRGLIALEWASIARESINTGNTNYVERGVIVAVKNVEGQGINMQGHADAIVCRPTPGDHLEQMKGRVDRPGQRKKNLVLVVLMAEHTIEEVKFSNIHLAGNFFREYIAPVAQRYRERIDLEATLAAGGTSTLKRGTVSGMWRQSLENAGQSGTFADVTKPSRREDNPDEEFVDVDAGPASGKNKRQLKAIPKTTNNKKGGQSNGNDSDEGEPKFAPRNKVFRNKGDPEAVRQAKVLAKSGQASFAVQAWLSPPKKPRTGLPMMSLLRFSDTTPPLVLDPKTIRDAVAHLSKDPILASLISRVGAKALIEDCGHVSPPTDARLFNYCLRAITFSMVSVDAGNSFLRRLAIKIGVCLENMHPHKRKFILNEAVYEMRSEGGKYENMTAETLLDLLLAGKAGGIQFNVGLVGALADTCMMSKGERTGYPHLCGETYPCGKNDDHSIFLYKAQQHVSGGEGCVSAGYSAAKANFLISMVNDFKSSKVSADKVAAASDREAARMILGLRGIGDWCAGGVLMHCLRRSNIMLYGDLTVRNFLNDLYEINHNNNSETMVESAADFPDNAENRNLIDALSTQNGWEPYRSVVCLLMYHLQEENLVLL